jgi:hypothetical protein
MDLVTFLTARLDEDEAIAKAATESAPAPWVPGGEDYGAPMVADATGDPLIYDEGTPTVQESAHIARHDPARVLRDVAAKRATLKRHRLYPVQPPICGTCCGGGGDEVSSVPWPCPDVCAVATVYSDHPGYDPAWAPA